MTVSRLLFCGHLTRYPGVNLVLSHGGVALPFALGRILRNYENHRDYAEPLAEFRRLYFDTARSAFSATPPARKKSCSDPIIPFRSATMNR
jgi:predicted TIM-barrel fold metal-dependent hydrolase